MLNVENKQELIALCETEFYEVIMEYKHPTEDYIDCDFKASGDQLIKELYVRIIKTMSEDDIKYNLTDIQCIIFDFGTETIKQLTEYETGEL